MKWMVLAAAVLVVPAASAHAENDTAAGAKNVLIGSVSTDLLTSAPPSDVNWFRYQVTAGRSYCVEVDNGEAETSIRDTLVTVYHTDATSAIGSNEDATDEPAGSLLSRFCYIAGVSEDNYAAVEEGVNQNNVPGTFRLRVVDTTLFCPWFFSGGGYQAFVLLKNTTASAHAVTVTLFNAAGTVLGTQSGSATANGSYNLQVSAASPGGFGLTNASGGVTIAHDGPPGGLIGNVTSLNFQLGISFDTPASPRQDYR